MSGITCECTCHPSDTEDREWQQIYLEQLKEGNIVLDDDGEVDEAWVHPLLHAQTQAAMMQVEDIDDVDVLTTAVTNASDLLARLSMTLQGLGIADDVIYTAMKEWPSLKVVNEDFED